MKVGDTVAKRAPVSLAVGLAFLGTEDLEIIWLMDRRLDPQDATLLVVNLDAVSVDAVLDANAFGAARETRGTRSTE